MIINSKILVSLAVIFSIIILDQATKAFVLSSEIPSVCNTGVAFGVLQGFPNLLISVGVLGVFVYLLVREHSVNQILDRVENDKPSQLSSSRKRGSGSRIKYGMTIRGVGYCLLIGGSLSNILDRLTRGCIVDFIQLPNWPAFNLADTSITVGVAILLFTMFGKKITHER